MMQLSPCLGSWLSVAPWVLPTTFSLEPEGLWNRESSPEASLQVLWSLANDMLSSASWACVVALTALLACNLRAPGQAVGQSYCVWGACSAPPEGNWERAATPYLAAPMQGCWICSSQILRGAVAARVWQGKACLAPAPSLSLQLGGLGCFPAPGAFGRSLLSLGLG